MPQGQTPQGHQCHVRPRRLGADQRLPLALVTAVPITRLAVNAVSEVVASPADLLAALSTSTGSLCFLRGGDGFVGWGVHDRFTATGPDAAAAIQHWFAEVCANLQVDDSVAEPGSGPIAFVSLGFDDTDVSVALEPRTVIRRRGGSAFTTRIEPVDGARPNGQHGTSRQNGAASARPIRRPGRVSYADAALSVAGFTSAVTAATVRIRAGELDEVVLAHDLEATTAADVDERFLLHHLARSSPD